MVLAVAITFNCCVTELGTPLNVSFCGALSDEPLETTTTGLLRPLINNEAELILDDDDLVTCTTLTDIP